jgi:MOSC domain-containing protein YiiM
MVSFVKDIAIRTTPHGAMQQLSYAAVSCATGIADDYRGKPSKRQVTVLSYDSWMTVCERHGEDLSWLIRRANLLIAGLVFNENHLGGIITIGNSLLEITGECDPCHRMDEQVMGLQTLLSPPFMGGVCCRVIKGGSIGIGDTVTIAKPLQQKLF